VQDKPFQCHFSLDNYDQWDGYRANRGRIYDHLFVTQVSTSLYAHDRESYGKNISNVAILAGLLTNPTTSTILK
jgi:hypothetical protein